MGDFNSAAPVTEAYATEVRRFLGRVLRSERFKDAPTLKRLLSYLVDRSLDDPAWSPHATVVAQHGLGKESGFRSSTDSSLRVTMRRLRRTLEHYYLTDGKEDPVKITLAAGAYVASFLTVEPQDSTDPVSKTERLMDWYLGIATADAYRETLSKVQHRLAENPENPILLACHADLLMDGWKHGYNADKKATDRAWRDIELARSLDAKNERIKVVHAFAELMEGNFTGVRAIGEALSHTATEENTMAQGAWMLALVADHDTESRQWDRKIFKASGLPGWIHHAPFLLSYALQDYESALDSAVSFGMPDWYWGYFDRAAALGQLGLQKAATLQLTELSRRYPRVAADPKPYLSAYIPVQEVREHVYEGLELAGIREWAQ